MHTSNAALRPALIPFACALIAAALLFTLAPSPAHAQSDSDAEVAKVLAEFQGKEPSIRDVQQAVLRYALIDNEVMDSWRTRARIAHIIPGDLRGSVRINDNVDGRDQTREELVRRDEEDPNSPFDIAEIQNTTFDDTDERLQYTLQADWEINRLIFNDDELDVASEVNKQVKLRQQLLNTVTKLYFERRRLQVERVLRPNNNAVRALKTELRIQELTADIDALTGGWFSTQLR